MEVDRTDCLIFTHNFPNEVAGMLVLLRITQRGIDGKIGDEADNSTALNIGVAHVLGTLRYNIPRDHFT